MSQIYFKQGWNKNTRFREIRCENTVYMKIAKNCHENKKCWLSNITFRENVIYFREHINSLKVLRNFWGNGKVSSKQCNFWPVSRERYIRNISYFRDNGKSSTTTHTQAFTILYLVTRYCKLKKYNELKNLLKCLLSPSKLLTFHLLSNITLKDNGCTESDVGSIAV